MAEIVIRTQAEFDALPASFAEHTLIIIRNDPAAGRIIVRGNRGNASVEAWGNASVKAYGNASVVAQDNASVWAYDNASVVAQDNASVQAYDNSSVKAYGNSSVEAHGNSSVKAYGNASVKAWGNVGVHLCSDSAAVALHMFAVCWILCKKARLTVKSNTATVIEPKTKGGTEGWLEKQAIEPNNGKVIVFKRVSVDFKTQEGKPQETLWTVGSTLEYRDWDPKKEECGHGKFHACSRPYFCDEFRSKQDDIYIAIEVNVSDLYAWEKPAYPHKIAFRKGTVLYRCDRFGRELK
jgi:hypothetical protein